MASLLEHLSGLAFFLLCGFISSFIWLKLLHRKVLTFIIASSVLCTSQRIFHSLFCCLIEKMNDNLLLKHLMQNMAMRNLKSTICSKCSILLCSQGEKSVCSKLWTWKDWKDELSLWMQTLQMLQAKVLQTLIKYIRLFLLK